MFAQIFLRLFVDLAEQIQRDELLAVVTLEHDPASSQSESQSDDQGTEESKEKNETPVETDEQRDRGGDIHSIGCRIGAQRRGTLTEIIRIIHPCRPMLDEEIEEGFTHSDVLCISMENLLRPIDVQLTGIHQINDRRIASLVPD